MICEEFTGVTFNDLDQSGTRIFRIFRSSEFPSSSTEIALNIPHKAHIVNRETTGEIIVYARNTKVACNCNCNDQRISENNEVKVRKTAKTLGLQVKSCH